VTDDSNLHPSSESDEISSRLLLALLLVSSLGFSAHRLRPMIQSKGGGWAELVSYTTGSLMVISVFPMIHSMIMGSVVGTTADRKKNVFLAFVSLVLAFSAVGAGVAFGWLVDPDFSEEGM